MEYEDYLEQWKKNHHDNPEPHEQGIYYSQLADYLAGSVLMAKRPFTPELRELPAFNRDGWVPERIWQLHGFGVGIQFARAIDDELQDMYLFRIWKSSENLKRYQTPLTKDEYDLQN